MGEVLQDDKVDAIICVAGGWAGGNAASNGKLNFFVNGCVVLGVMYVCHSTDLVKNSDLMWKQSVWTSVLAAKLASKHLKE